jgi:hypothetical protein
MLQQRQVTQQVTEHQQANQKFQTTFSDVKRDGYRHDARTEDGQSFRLAGNGAAWSQNGREVMSGAGKGKDDVNKAFQLGERIGRNWDGYRPIDVPWKVYATHMQSASASFFQQQWGDTTPHWLNLHQKFSDWQPKPHLPMMTTATNLGGLQSLYGGPMGGSALWGNAFQASLSARFEMMQGSVSQLLSVFDQLDRMRLGMQQARWSSGIAG